MLKSEIQVEMKLEFHLIHLTHPQLEFLQYSKHKGKHEAIRKKFLSLKYIILSEIVVFLY